VAKSPESSFSSSGPMYGINLTAGHTTSLQTVSYTNNMTSAQVWPSEAVRN